MTPRISEVNPAGVTAGTKDVSLTIEGSGFVEGSRIQIKDSEYFATFVNSSEPLSKIHESWIKTPAIRIKVISPPPSGEISNEFEIKAT